MNDSQTSQITSRKMKGQALVEFALVAPVLMLIIFGIIEFGRMFFIYSQVNNAAREAVHYGITTDIGDARPHYLDCGGIAQVAEDFAFLSPITVTITYDNGGNGIDGIGAMQGACPSPPISGTIPFNSDNPGIAYIHTLGDRIVITTTATFEPLVSFVNIPPITFSASVARTILKGLPFDESLPSAPVGCYNLVLDPSPFVGGRVLVIDPGAVCPEDDRFYDDGAEVVVLAVPNTHYEFAIWEDDVDDMPDPPTNITGTVIMDENKSIVGVFESELDCYFLDSSVTPDGAAGSIVTTPSNCQVDFQDGWLDTTLVRINAVPDTGYSFVNWSGNDASGNTNPQDILFDEDKQVTANFVADACYSIAVNRIPGVGGDYLATPPMDCFDGSGWQDGTVVTLDATPSAGYTFNSWAGYDFDVNPITMTMNITTPSSIDLTFDSIATCYTLEQISNPNTGGGIWPVPHEYNCAGGWTEDTVLNLYALPNPGYSFGSWDGSVTITTTNPTAITMDANKSVLVNFDYTGNDVSIIKSGTVLVQEGGIITYTLRVVNNGINPATFVIVEDTLPATVTYTGYSSLLGSCAATAGGVSCYLGTLPAGPSSTEIEIYATADTAGTAVNTASVTAAESDPNPGNNQDSATTIIKLPIDLEITKSGAATSIQGEPLVYTLLVTNHGPGEATNVIINDPLPADTQHVSTSSPLCNIDASQNIRCFVGTMNSGDTFTTDITITPLGSGGAGGDVTAPATLTGDTYVDQNSPDTPHNGSDILVYQKNGAQQQIGLVQFALPSSGVATSAILTLTVSGDQDAGQIGVYTVNDPWDETIDYTDYINNGSTTPSVIGGGLFNSDTKLVFNVTAMVNNWLGGATNNGFAIVTTQNNKRWTFDSSDTGTAPELSITMPVPAGSSTLVNEATVSASEGETDTSNNSDDATTTINVGTQFIIAKGAVNDRACGEAGDSVIIYGYNWLSTASGLDILFEYGEVPSTQVSLLTNHTPGVSPWQTTVTLPADADDDHHTIRVTHGTVDVTTRFQIPCPAPDLIVSDPVLIGTQPITSHTPISFTVVVTNIGNLAAISEFPVGLYIDPSPAPIVGDTYITETARAVLNLIGGLEPSNSHTLTMAIDAGLIVTGTYDAYAVADSDPSPTGQIAERNEMNNLSAAVSLTVVEHPNPPEPPPTPEPPTISGTISGLAYIIDAGFNVQQYTQVELYDITGGGNVLVDSDETDGGGSFTFLNVPAGATTLYKVTGCIIKDSQPYFYSIQPIILPLDGSSEFINMELQPVGSCG